MYTLRSFTTTGLLLAILLTTELPAQVSVYSLQIGGPGTQGSEGGDPPVLSDGSDATGTLDYIYESRSGVLVLCVTNSTPQTAGEDNPVIKTVYFNIPRHTDVSIAMLSQTAPGGANPSFNMVVDSDIENTPNENPADGFGTFAVGLYSGMGVQGGIANAAASQWAVPVSELVMGTTTFTFMITGNDAAHLAAADFALSPSSIPPGDKLASAVLKFQAGGVGGNGSAFIGTEAGCIPGLWYAGEPCVGNNIDFVFGVGPDCHGCLLFSTDPTPFSLFGILTAPMSPPYRVIWAGQTTAEAQSIVLSIPPNPSLVGFEGYFALVLAPAGSTALEDVLFSPVVPFKISQ